MPETGVLTRTYFVKGVKCQTAPTSHVHKINSRPEMNIYALLQSLKSNWNFIRITP